VVRKFLETFFRHKWLFLTPPVVIPLVVGVWTYLNAPTSYEATASISVSRPRYISYSDGDPSSQWRTPAQLEIARIQELLTTRAFVMDIARRTSLAPFVGSPTSEVRIWSVVNAQQVRLLANGDHVVKVLVRSPRPDLSYEVVKALLDAHSEKTMADQAIQADVAISFYGARLQEVEATLAKSNAALRRYVATARPTTSGSTRAASDAPRPTVVDPQLDELQSRAELDSNDVERARSVLEQARLQSMAAQQGRQLGFQVMDPPEVPIFRSRDRRAMMLAPIAGLLVGLILSGVVLVLLVATDRSLRTQTDLPEGSSILGALPVLRRKPLPRGAGPDDIRRAMGFVAGSAIQTARQASFMRGVV
jgi:uncharacterized protein involved in exopolysaccharide biosynthesis